MALQRFNDAAGREAYWDPQMDRVFTEGGSRDTFYDKAGWNRRQLDKWGPPSGSSGGDTIVTGDTMGIFDAALERLQRANEPARESYEASKGETREAFGEQRERFEGRRDPLKERYQNLINSIKGNQQTAESRTSRTQSREMARRGILPSSGVYDQTMEEALNPVTQQYTGMIKDTGFQREEDLSRIDDLIAQTLTGETSAIRDINNAIAMLSSGAGQTALGAAQNIYNTNESARQFDVGQQFAERQFEESTLPYRQAQIANMGDSGGGGAGGGDMTVQDLFEITRGGGQIGSGASTGGGVSNMFYDSADDYYKQNYGFLPY